MPDRLGKSGKVFNFATVNDTAMKHMIVGFGEVLWDLLPEGKKMGGAPANFACHVAQFGLASCVVSAVGDDRLGEELLASLDARGLNRLIERVPYPTGTVQVELDAAGVPQYTINEAVAWDHIPWTPQLEALARQTKAVCFGSLVQRSAVSRATLGRFLDTMPQCDDSLVVFDVNLRQHFYDAAILDASMRRCNVLKINDEELETVSRLFGIPQAGVQERCRWLSERYGLKMLILTCGINGSYLFSAEGCSFRETPRVEVADTVGAGDSFTAAFIASILKGWSLPEAHRTAVEVSAFVCTQNGAMPQLPAEWTK